MLKVGLTGGIGCGKTTVTALFAGLGTPVIDADDISRDLVKPGQPALALIAQVFGDGIIKQDGGLDRAKLRELVFSDQSAKKQLEAILHPRIYQAIQGQLTQLHTAYCIISVPLLLETGMTGLVDRILVIDCPVETQIERVRKRDNLTVTRVQSIIDSQVPRTMRIQKADDLIDNTESTDMLAEQVKKLHNLYISLSHQQTGLTCL